MKLFEKLLCLAFFGVLLVPVNLYAVGDATTTPVAGETGDFNDFDGRIISGRDYFGVVTTGVTVLEIANSPFSSWETSPPPGAVAGRDHDDGSTKPATRTATWTLMLPQFTQSIDNLVFSGTLAAADADLGNWQPTGTDLITLELKIDDVTIVTQSYQGNGTGQLELNPPSGSFLTASGVSVTLSDTDLGIAAITSVQLLATVTSDSSQEDWWLSGTLSYDETTLPVELQSFSIE
jgi:hypothetical protein